jgi:predicted small lipoprotein YifL
MRPRSLAQRAALSALAAALALSATGCGQKGALYLPDRGGEVVTRPMQTPAESPAAEAPEQPEAPRDESEPGADAPNPPIQPPR